MKFLSNMIHSFLGKPAKVRAYSKNENNLEEMIAKANDLTGSMNQLLKDADTSNNIQMREGNLLEVKVQLKALKDICSKNPAINITALDKFETSIEKVASKTLDMKAGLKPPPIVINKKTITDNNDNANLEIINNHLRVINESIDIASKSKNPNTTESRLQLARKALNEARELARQFSLNIDGFDEAENEINRLANAEIAGTPKVVEGMREIEQDPMYQTPSRNLLKEATFLKKEKRYIEACNKLREAYLAEGADILMIEERLRYPMYLQLAGKNDEGWMELNKLSKKYNDQFSYQVILKQMQIFLKKENNSNANNPLRVIEFVDIKKSSEYNAELSGKFEFHSGNPVKSWLDNQDVINRLQFSATMQLRTPLRVLKRHGEIHSDIHTKPPKIEHEMWEGIWIPKAKIWRELGLDIDEFKESTVATDIGPITVTQYLPFLISVREIIEKNESIDSRINVIRTKPMTGSWKTYVDKHGGIEEIIKKFFPRFIDTIPNLNILIIEELYKLGIVTPNKLEMSSDEVLLAIKGIGQVKLKTIRYFCSGITNNRDDIRQEKVSR